MMSLKARIEQLERRADLSLLNSLDREELLIQKELAAWTTDELIDVVDNDVIPPYLIKRLEMTGIEFD